MNVAIMQPYFLPYIGYFQLIRSVELFILYDNIKYTKKGWINRNRILQNGKDIVFSLPLENASNSLTIGERRLARDYSRDKLINQIAGAYRRAPYFAATMPLVEQIVRHEQTNLFLYLHNAITRICDHLAIRTIIRTSSEITIDHELKSQDKVLALCAAVGAKTYINAVGGTTLYAREAFNERGIVLKFIQSRAFSYVQFGDPFVPWLSIIDVLMFNPQADVRARIDSDFDLV